MANRQLIYAVIKKHLKCHQHDGFKSIYMWRNKIAHNFYHPWEIKRHRYHQRNNRNVLCTEIDSNINPVSSLTDNSNHPSDTLSPFRIQQRCSSSIVEPGNIMLDGALQIRWLAAKSRQLQMKQKPWCIHFWCITVWTCGCLEVMSTSTKENENDFSKHGLSQLHLYYSYD